LSFVAPTTKLDHLSLVAVAKYKDLHMNTIASLIHIFGGPEGVYASIENPSDMRLVIEEIGVGPRRHLAISIAHYFESNGDLCQDPEMGLELVPQGDGSLSFEPFFFQMAMPPIYEEVYPAGPESEDLTLKRKLTEFLRTWDRNLAAQGFLKAAQRSRGGSSSSSSSSVV
jgi:hypothetical protein